MKSPFRKGTKVTNDTYFAICIKISGLIEGEENPGLRDTMKLLGAGETTFIGPEVYLKRMIHFRRATKVRKGEAFDDIWRHTDTNTFRDNAQVLLRWNEKKVRLEFDARRGNRVGRSMGALILRRTVKKYVKDLRAKVRHEDAARALEDDLPTEDQEPTTKNPLRKGTTVTNRTNHEIAIHFLGSNGFIKILGKGETTFIGPEIYNSRTITIRRAIDLPDQNSEYWLRLMPFVLKNNAELLVRWNEETQILKLDVRRGNRLGRSMGGFIMKRRVKMHVKGLTAKLRA